MLKTTDTQGVQEDVGTKHDYVQYVPNSNRLTITQENLLANPCSQVRTRFSEAKA